jgi:hypothetical protein
MAEKFPDLKIYTCEINEENYKKARRNLKKFDNVQIFKGGSPEFLKSLIDSGVLGERPLFFLDAHWWDNWPLEEEIKIITEGVRSAVILIDDFKVPGDDRFKFDWYGDKVCSLDLIKPKMSRGNEYGLLFPSYGVEDLEKGKFYPEMSGYPVIFQNMDSEFRGFLGEGFVKKFFVDRSDLVSFDS